MRKGYVPKTVEDYGDGGAFPEIHVAQYPLDMGRKKPATTKDGAPLRSGGDGGKQIVSLSVDDTGRVKYEDVLGHDKSKIVYSQYKDLVPKQFGATEMERPDEEEIEETTQSTKEALERIVKTKISAAQPTSYVDKQAAVEYVKYTPSQQGGGHNSNATSRVIRMIEVAKDPMEPPKFKIKKNVKRPPSPPAPVMHSPPRKLSVQESQEWRIPSCISNWKNSKGYAIELDKRLAADGRSLQRSEINDKFAHFSQALYIAETNAREEVTARAELERKLAQKEKERKQDMLRKLAEDVRNERAAPRETSYESEYDMRGGSESHDSSAPPSRASKPRIESDSSDDDSSDSDREDDRERKERDRMREEKKREREREYRMEASGKKSKINRDQERDISEKIALGQVQNVRTEDSLYDQRLFNQSEGMSSGFNGGDDESYNVYSKPLFGDKVSNAIYRPRANAEDANLSIEDALSTSRFKPHKEFSGTDSAKERSGPVMFEQERGQKKTSADPFG
eukprot:gene6100-7067_t